MLREVSAVKDGSSATTDKEIAGKRQWEPTVGVQTKREKAMEK